MRRFLTVAALAAALLAGGVACSHSAASHPVAKAKASISQAAKSPAVQRAEKHAETLIIGCATRPGMVHLAHPIRTAENILYCADPKGSRAALKACARRVVLKSGTNQAADIKGLATCIDGVKSS